MLGMGKRTGIKRENAAAPPLPHEVNLVAPPVLTQPLLPPESPRRCDNVGVKRRLNSVAAVALLGGTFAVIATLTFAVHRQIASSQYAATFDSIAAPASTTLHQLPTEIVEAVEFGDKPRANETGDVEEPDVENNFEIVAALKRSPSEPPSDKLVRARERAPFDGEETGCPAEQPTKIDTLLALTETYPDSFSHDGEELAWEKVGGTGTIDPVASNCLAGRSVEPPISSTCDSGTCRSPTRLVEPNSRSFGTKIVFAETMKQARELAAEQDKLLFVMHVSGNFAIEGFT